MHDVLLIYETNPESIKVFYINVDDETFGKLQRCHGHLDEYTGFPDDLSAWLSKFVANLVPNYVSVPEPMQPFKIPGEAVVIHTGFGL